MNSRSKKTWHYKEVQYLKNAWGTENIKTIAKKLNRSVLAVRTKAQKLGLKDWLLYSEYISLNQFYFLVFGRTVEDYTTSIWIREGMPIKNIRKLNKSYRMISLESFVRWYKTHKRIIDISLTNDGDFGIEPDWLKEKRKADKMALAYKSRPWTFAEDNLLKQLLKAYRYGYREISVKLKRTEGAIKRRMLDLKIKERPLRADPHNPWTRDELDKVKELYLKGYKSVVIAEFVNRSAIAINGILERYGYFGEPPEKSSARKMKDL